MHKQAVQDHKKYLEMRETLSKAFESFPDISREYLAELVSEEYGMPTEFLDRMGTEHQRYIKDWVSGTSKKS